MHRILRSCIACLCSLVFTYLAEAQDTRINGEFYNTKFDQFVKQVEINNMYHFYYDEADLGSFVINIKIVDQPITEALKLIFNNTSYRYSIDEANHVFITKNTNLQTTLSEDFFNPDNKKTSPEPDALLNEPAKNEKIKSSFTENQLFEIGSKSSAKKSTPVITGFVRDEKNGEALPGASVYIDSLSAGVLTDQFGYYSLTVPVGMHTLEVTSIGMKQTHRHILVYANGKLNIELHDDIPSLKTVFVTSEKRSNIKSSQMGIERLSIKTIKQVPVVFGEADILRVVLTLPGVTSVGEATTGFNVRGGAADQNLILLDGATIYNAAHFFGFFAAFNPDIVKDIELYKSSSPEKFGGRLSSVLEITNREGNKKIYTGSAGIGLLTSRFSIEGAIVKDKTSFIFGARTTYEDWLLNLLPQAYKNS